MEKKNGWVIIDYTKWGVPGEDKRCQVVWTETDLFEIVDRAKRENTQITVYSLGNCLLDWS